MRKTVLTLLFLSLVSSAVFCFAEEKTFNYRFAEAEEAAKLLLANRDYYNSLNQFDLDFRMQKQDATLKELESFAAEQTLDWTEEEKNAVNTAMEKISSACKERGYDLPLPDEIVFAKTTMQEECGAGAYTHGTEIYLGENLMHYGIIDDPAIQTFFQTVVAHELFHIMTRSYPDFQEAMYGILGFSFAKDDFDFSTEIDAIIISNPDVSHHNSYAAFEIDGEMKNCTVIFTTGKPFEQPGDNFFDDMVTGLVPVDDLSVMYTSEDAANFWEVFGKNTKYVIDPEETMADNFAYTILFGPDGGGSKIYESPEIIAAIDSYLKGTE